MLSKDKGIMVQRLKDYTNRAVKIGVRTGINIDTEKQIILTNTLAFLYAVIVGTFTLIFVYLDLTRLAQVSFLWFVSILCWVEVNRRHKYLMASIGLVFFTDLFGFIVCWLLGREVKFHYGFFAATGVPLILFGQNKKLVAFFLLFAMLCFFTLEWLPDSLTNFGVVSEQGQRLIHTVINLTIFLSTFSTTYYYYEANLMSEKKLKSSLASAEIINQKLKDTQKTLVQSAKMAALGEMAGGVAHEINTPLAAILMNAQMILRQIKNLPDISPDIIKKANSIVSICHRISKIIIGLKIFSTKEESGTFELFSIQSLISNTLDLCQERFKNYGIPILVNQTDITLNGIGNPIQLSQTLLNLLNNSFDAVQTLPEKWLRIDIEKNLQNIEISVTDSGPGIPEEIANKMFEPFFTSKGIGNGTGLGLSISKGIMKQNGGDLVYDSASPNTRFIIKLPTK